MTPDESNGGPATEGIPAEAGRLPSYPIRHSLKKRAVVGAGLGLIAAGLLGVDRWVYSLSLMLKTPNPVDHDFHEATNWFWELCRLPGSLVWGLAAFFVVLAFAPRGWRMAFISAVSVLFAVGVGVVGKILVGRVRPDHAMSPFTFLPPIKRFASHAAFSFPSGEVTAAFAIAAALTYSFPRGKVLFYALATLTAVARLEAGAHYFSDVVAGAMLGTILTNAVLGFLLDRTKSET